MAFFTSNAIVAAARLGIPEALRDGPMTNSELAAALHADERSLFRLMRALGSIGFFDVSHGRYELNALSRQLLPESPASMAPLMRLAAEDWSRQVWGGLAESIRRGKPAAELVFGTSFFDYLAEHPAASDVFNAAMLSTSAHTAACLLASYDFEPVRTLVDVGGGYGQFLAFAVARHQQLRGVLFELPHTAREATARLRNAGCEKRIEFVAGDFFKDPWPAGADIYVLMNVIHDWGDQDAIRILTRGRDAIRSGGRLLVVEIVLPEDHRPTFGTIFDLQMLLLFDGGRERTHSEFRALFAEAGLRITRAIPTASASSIMELAAAAESS